jgi:hypothetical protein
MRGTQTRPIASPSMLTRQRRRKRAGATATASRNCATSRGICTALDVVARNAAAQNDREWEQYRGALWTLPNRLALARSDFAWIFRSPFFRSIHLRCDVAAVVLRRMSGALWKSQRQANALQNEAFYAEKRGPASSNAIVVGGPVLRRHLLLRNRLLASSTRAQRTACSC